MTRAELADRLGVSLHTIKPLLSGLDVTDWADVKRPARIMPSGIGKIVAALANPDVTLSDVIEPLDEPGRQITVRVTRIALNPHVLLATDGLVVFRVRVKDSSRFRRGMSIDVFHSGGDLCEFRGRMPRGKL